MIRTKEISCPSCKTKHRYPMSMPTVVELACTKCAQVNNMTKGQPTIVGNNIVFNADNVHIPFETVGVIDGVEWMLVATAVYGQNSTNRWTEHLLINDAGDRRFLTVERGNWAFYDPFDIADSDYTEINFKHFYRGTAVIPLYETYKSIIFKAAGCFDYQVQTNAEGKAYFEHPSMFISEKRLKEHSYFIGSYISRKDIEAIFPSISKTYSPAAFHPMQPFYFNINPKSFYYILLSFILLLIFIYPFEILRHKQDTVLSVKFDTGSGVSNDTVFVTDPFILDKRKSALEYQMTSDVSQDWVAYDITLVNDRTQVERTISAELSYFSGADHEGSWTENEQHKTFMICEVDTGRYHLEVKPYVSDKITPYITGTRLEVVWDPADARNYWVLIVALAVCMFIMYLFERNFIESQWKDSPFNPYIKDEPQSSNFFRFQ